MFILLNKNPQKKRLPWRLRNVWRYHSPILPLSLTVGAAAKTQRDVEINQLAFFWGGAFSGLWPCHTGNIRKDVILTTKYLSFMGLGLRIAEKKRWDPGRRSTVFTDPQKATTQLKKMEIITNTQHERLNLWNTKATTSGPKSVITH